MRIYLRSSSKNTTILCEENPDTQIQTEAVMKVNVYNYITYDFPYDAWKYFLLFKLFSCCFSFRGFWAARNVCDTTCYPSRWAGMLSWKVSRTHAPSWLPACWGGVFGHPLFCASPPHGTRTEDGQGCPVLQQPGQNHLNPPGTCEKEVIVRFP